MWGSLFGFGMGIILASFHICGMMFSLRDVLYMCVRYCMASGPRFFRCLMFTLSGPVELLFGACVIASFTWAGVMSMFDDVSVFVC